MKKLLLSAALLSSIAIAAPAGEAKATANSVEAPQIRVRVGRDRRNFGRRRTVTTTRVVGFGRNRVRETIQTTYLANGRTITRVISRQRVGGRWNRG